jgi:hypothetical protein
MLIGNSDPERILLSYYNIVIILSYYTFIEFNAFFERLQRCSE